LKARYSGSSCNAYRHWQQKGWHWWAELGLRVRRVSGGLSESAYWPEMDAVRYVARQKARCILTTSFQSDWTEAMMNGICVNCVKCAIWAKGVGFLVML
jgi:hypothetical protein